MANEGASMYCMGFVLFMGVENNTRAKRTAQGCTSSTLWEDCISYLVSKCQPDPAMQHAEVVIPIRECRHNTAVATVLRHFGTYLGKHADWQTCKYGLDKNGYYQRQKELWRAVPVLGTNGNAQSLYKACDQNQGAPYSLVLHYSSASWCPALARCLCTESKSRGQCATIVARVLRASGMYTPDHSEAWYGPSKLYIELANALAKGPPLLTQSHHSYCEAADTLLGGRDIEVRQLECDAVNGALLHLSEQVQRSLHADTNKACTASNSCTAQQKLATALLRYSGLTRRT